MSPLLIQLGLSAANAEGTALYNGITGDIENNVNNPAIYNYLTNVSAINSQIAEQQAFDAVNSNLQDFSNVNNNDALLNLGIQQTSTVNEPNGWQNIGMYTGKQLQNLGNLDVVGTFDTAIQMYKDLFNIGNDSKADKINKEINRINQQNVDNFYNQVTANNKRQQRQAMMNYFAEGGSLEELNGVTKIGAGSTHEQNHNNGVQMGIAPDNLPNLVEENEVVYKDYVYSNRLKPSKSLLKQYNLPEKYAGKTFAELAEILQKESEDRPNDPVSLQTLNDWMSRLTGAQEEYKAKQEERRLAKAVDSMSDEEKAALMSSLVQPMTQQEGIDLGQPMYADGGKIHIAKNKRGTFTAAAKKRGMGVQEFASKVLASPENYTEAMRKKAQFAHNAKSFKHADGGHLFPLGGLTPTTNGFGETVFPQWSLGIDYSKLGDDIKYYPTTNQLNSGLDFDTLYNYNKAMNINIQAPAFTATPKIKDIVNNKLLARGLGESLRYAPSFGAALGALEARLQPKDYTLANELRDIASQYKPMSAPHIGGYRRYTPYDVNLGDAENIALTARALEANRGQNRATQGALNTAVLNAAQKTAAARNLAAQQANEANRLAVDTYNLGIDQFNTQQQSNYDRLNQQILQNRLNTLMAAANAEDASKTAWAQNVNTTATNMYNQIGNVGKDSWNQDQMLMSLAMLDHEELVKVFGSEAQAKNIEARLRSAGLKK